MSIVQRVRAFGYTATLIVAAIVLYVPIAFLFVLGTLAARPLKTANAGMDVAVQRDAKAMRQRSDMDMRESA